MIDLTGTYKVDNWPGVAVRVRGYYEERTWNEEFDDEEVTTDETRVKVVMVGDDTEHIVDVDDLMELQEGEFCGECGQIGCGWH